MATEGLIQFYELVDWWESALQPEERDRLASRFHPLGRESDSRPLTEGRQAEYGAMATPAGFWSALIRWPATDEEGRAIRRKIRDKLVSLVEDEQNIIARHFVLQVLIREFYKERADTDARATAIRYCRDQIAIAPAVAAVMRSDFPDQLPRHIGYEQLSIILQKDKRCAEVMALCAEALARGWSGDWTKRIERCRGQLAKAVL
jgi:hypothetical protein